MTSKGRLTIRASVREALDLHTGDEMVFRVERSRAPMAKTPDSLSRSRGACRCRRAKRGTPWEEVDNSSACGHMAHSEASASGGPWGEVLERHSEHWKAVRDAVASAWPAIMEARAAVAAA